ncbi:uncharacterized protein [Physcomitrium patens]|uniref:uncharacterized protein n=1 Tax=Physcomitrium patens TaxID=3218 RepID=UPI003CCCD34E
MESHPIDDRLIDESLFLVTTRPAWYSRIIEFLTTQQLLVDLSKDERRKIRVNSHHFVVLENRLYRRGLDGVLRHCVMEDERFARNDLHMQLPLHISLPLVPFEKWGIDYVGEIHPHSSRRMAYIVVATEYLTKWAKAKAMRTNDAKNAAIFLFENVITRFGVPKFLVSDRATLWAYRTTFKVTMQATPFSLVYGLEAVLPIEFEVPSLRITVDSRLIDRQPLKTRFYELEALDENRRRGTQHIEAIQRRRKVVFDKRNKTRVLQPGMLVLL